MADDSSGYSSFCYSPLSLSLGRQQNATHSTGTYDTRFVFWQDGDFGQCFEQFIILSLSCSLLSILSSYYIGQTRLSLVRRKTPSLGLALRTTLMILLFINSLVQFVASFWLDTSRHSYSLLLSQVTSLLAWLLHSVSLIMLSLSPFHIGFGPLPLNLSWGLTLLSSILYFRTILRSLTLGINHTSLLTQVTCYVQFSLQICYLLCLLIPARKTTLLRYKTSRRPLMTNFTTQYKEDDPLLEEDNEVLITSHGIVPYGSIQPRPSITRYRIPDTVEDRANPLSLMTFWWLQPLMRRGSEGLLQRPQDLPIISKSLSTCLIRGRFQTILRHRVREGRNEVTLVDSEGQSLRSLDRIYLSQSNIHSPPSPSPSPPSPRPPTVSLAKGLNKSFGWHYYPLGLMKLFNDVIGFGGPLLLHQLVAFMENKTEPISHGYYYALGLFLSTLITAFLNAHFTYQVNKVCIKVRAALVTEIFRKSLSVNSVNMSKFSIGQVVNYMSTDTDRIVNFCNSFHQFWSLPFQIAVSLYLLYRQVGLAFLAGLVFSILLIPINRWLAKKIGQLSTAMMSQKDNRVKLMTEILTGIRVIKFYAWERHFTNRVNTIRSAELKSLAGRKYLDALCVYFWATTPVLISILTFTTYVALGNKLTAAKVVLEKCK